MRAGPENPAAKRKKPCGDCGTRTGLATYGLVAGRVALCAECFEKRARAAGAFVPKDEEGRPEIVPLSITDANVFVDRWHRHNEPLKAQFLFALGLMRDGIIVGAAVVGRPAARMLEDGYTAEVRRVCVREGVKNGCSMLYGAAWRAARALGYRRLLTYTLPEESGASLRGAGWKLIGEAGGGNWSRPSRKRLDVAPTQTKLRWEAPT